MSSAGGARLSPIRLALFKRCPFRSWTTAAHISWRFLYEAVWRMRQFFELVRRDYTFICCFPPIGNPRPREHQVGIYNSWMELCESVAVNNLEQSYNVEKIVRGAFRFSQRDVDEVNSQFGRHVCSTQRIAITSMIGKIRLLYEEPVREDDEEKSSSTPTQVQTTKCFTVASARNRADNSNKSLRLILKLRRTQGWVRASLFFATTSSHCFSMLLAVLSVAGTCDTCCRRAPAFQVTRSVSTTASKLLAGHASGTRRPAAVPANARWVSAPH